MRLPLWQALVAEVLLHRTRAAQVVPVFERLRRKYRSASAFGRATASEIEELARPLGLRWRGRLLRQLASDLGELRGRLPLELDDLQRLPGVGPYGAAATLSLHANRRAVIVDANVVRVLCRLVGMSWDAETRRKAWIWVLADRLTPEHDFRAYNYALLDLAMTICRPGKPRCSSCPLTDLCATAACAHNRLSSDSNSLDGNPAVALAVHASPSAP